MSSHFGSLPSNQTRTSFTGYRDNSAATYRVGSASYRDSNTVVKKRQDNNSFNHDGIYNHRVFFVNVRFLLKVDFNI